MSFRTLHKAENRKFYEDINIGASSNFQQNTTNSNSKPNPNSSKSAKPKANMVAKEDGQLSDVSDSELSPSFREISVIKFSTNETDIKLKRNPVTYHKTCNYDTSLTEKDHWHMIVIHQDKLNYTKRKIFNGIFDVVSDSDFFPIAYRQSKNEDYFLVRQSRVAIGKLFKNGLKIKVSDKDILYLSVRLCVADYSLGQIYPSSKMLRACMDRFNDLSTCQESTRTLNLDNFASSPELTEIYINLANKCHLELLCTTLNNSKELLNSITGLKLSNNSLKHLKPFEILPRTNLQLLDLRNNEIRDVQELKHLEKLTFTELLIEKNPLTIFKGYEASILEMFPTVSKINGTEVKKRTAGLIAPDIPIEVIFLGDIIKSNEIEQHLFFKKYKSSDMWHQVLIHHEGKFNKDQLLTAIFNQLTGHEFYPCYYKTGNDYDTFFIRNCFDQMEVLFNAKLVVTIPNTVKQFKLTFKMNVANFKADHIEVVEQINKMIGASFNVIDKIYNLENVSARNELKNIEFCLSNPRTIAFVLLQGARRFLQNIEHLKLINNNIRTARGMHPLNWMKNLKSIDLSNNKIASLSDLEMIPKTPTTEVCLIGNPLCKANSIPADYIAKVSKIFPNLTDLDGESISPDDSLNIRKNYLCSPEAYDLVEQFVEYFFTTYDSLARHSIKGAYHESAILSISANFNGISRSNEDNIKTYIEYSRNFLKPSSNVHAKFFYGPEQIASLFKKFGNSEHDFRSFTIDLIHYTPTLAIITVNGVFKDQGATLNEEELIMGFVRTFTLKLTAYNMGMFGKSSEYKITNEQILFYRPSIAQTRTSFKKSNPQEEPATTEKDKEGLIILFQELTSLNPSWCGRCLKEANWDFKSALELFVHLCQENKLPDQAFKFSKC